MLSMEAWQTGKAFLAQHGLNMVATLDVAALPPELKSSLYERCGEFECSQVLLVGNGGPAFWRSFAQQKPETSDPVDSFVRQIVERCFAEYWGNIERLWLYPSPTFFPVSPFGIQAGWHRPSPLGQGIHAHYGLWFAYRAMLGVPGSEFQVPSRSEPERDIDKSPCEICIDKPCLQACPVQALTNTEPPDIAACLHHRWKEQSTCRDRCLARLACPVGKEHQYDLEQIQYHYLRSLQMTKQANR